MTFNQFEVALQAQFDAMLKKSIFLFSTNVELMWEKYLKSFPEGADPVFRVRTVHDCVYCRRFIQRFGNIVIVDDKYQLVSIWDAKHLSAPYDVVAKSLSEHVKASKIQEAFYYNETVLGIPQNRSLENDITVTYRHLHLENVPARSYYRGLELNAQRSEMRSRHETFSLALNEFKEGALQDVLDLISENNIYRGKEFEANVKAFLGVLREFNALKEYQKENFIWKNTLELHVGITKIRGSAVGTLLIDVSSGLSLEESVRKFESIMAPSNYKRPKAIVSNRMIEEATKELTEKGYLAALYRRSAKETDIPVKECLFVNRDLKKLTDIFDELKEGVPVNPFKFNGLNAINFDDFVKMLPNIKNLEILFTKNIENNLVTLLSSDEKKKLFKWDSPISWAYKGDVTDSIKSRVEKAGGNIHGTLRISLAWSNFDDLDLHLKMPNGQEIYFGNQHMNGGTLDVDANRSEPLIKNPVENIIFPGTVPEGHYVAYVHNYRYREPISPGFKVEMEFSGQTYTFDYPLPIRSSSKVIAFDFIVKDKMITIQNSSSLKSGASSEEIWAMNTNVFQKVSMILPSPNHWDGLQTGNKHYFFIVPAAKALEPVLPFFNEYLSNEVLVHKRFVEVLSNKIRVTPDKDQISGFGFSETQDFELILKTDSQIIKVKK